MVCGSCGQPCDPRHVCAAMLVDVGVLERDRRGQVHVPVDKSPSVAELDHRRRDKRWRP